MIRQWGLDGIAEQAFVQDPTESFADFQADFNKGWPLTTSPAALFGILLFRPYVVFHELRQVGYEDFSKSWLWQKGEI